MCSKKLKEERQSTPPVYNHPSDEDIEEILSLATYDGTEVTVDDITFDVHEDI